MMSTHIRGALFGRLSYDGIPYLYGRTMSQLITDIWPTQPQVREPAIIAPAARVNSSASIDHVEPPVVACPAWKRIMDVLGASLGLIVLSPLLLLIAALIKCASRGPVLFRQQRYGL